MALDSASWQQHMEALAADPAATPGTLEDGAWEVLSDVLYEEPNAETAALLPAARDALQRNVDNKELATADTFRYYRSRTAVAMWGVVAARARGESIPDKTRAISTRNLGRIISDAAGPSYVLQSIEPRTRESLHYAIALTLLLRPGEQSGVYGLPSPPQTNMRIHKDDPARSSHFHMYGFTPNGYAPVRVVTGRDLSRIVAPNDILPVHLGIITADNAHGAILREFKNQGTITNRYRWITDLLARIVATDNEQLTSTERSLYDNTSSNLAQLVSDFSAGTYVPKVYNTNYQTTGNYMTASEDY